MRKKGLVLALCALMLTGCGGPAVEADGTAALTEEVKYVALTFDDGPRRGTTDVLLDGLKERGAAATFFLIGESISGKEDLVERMAAEGHQVGNHTWTHLRLETESAAVIQDELSRTDAAIGAILGGSSYWVRVPYGLLSQGSEGLIQVPMVKWSVDPRDWESRNKEKIVSAVLEAVEPGSIILLHDIYTPSVEAALEIVDKLQAEGYWFVTVEELLELYGIEAQPGVMYRKAQ